MFELTDQQNEARKLFLQWWKGERFRPYFEIGGYPGTGKSTLVYHIISELNLEPSRIKFVTFTGKAALELSRKNCPTKTVHSVFYELIDVAKLDSKGEIILFNNRPIKKTVFVKKRSPIDADLIVIDEGSMINTKMAEDILSFGIPVIVLGDLDQLDPVFGEPYFLRTPDYILTEIMRQKKGDPIIELSRKVLHGDYIAKGIYGDNCRVISKDDITDDHLTSNDIVICGKNLTRNDMNNYIREKIYGRRNASLYKNDKIIFRKNNWTISSDVDGVNIPLINGLIGYIDDINLPSFSKEKGEVEIDFRPEFLEEPLFREIKINLKHLYGIESIEDNLNSRFNTSNTCEWGNVITCHLAQGSQYDNVFIYNEVFGTRAFFTKWLYTAVTRAKSGLTLAI